MSLHTSFRRWLILLGLICIVAAAALPPQDLRGAATITSAVRPASPSLSLYRTSVTLAQPFDLARLKRLGVSILRESLDQALVLADGQQLAALARLRFDPQNTDEIAALVQANIALQPQAVASLHSLVTQSQAVRSSQTADSDTTAQARLRSIVQAVSPQQQVSLAALASADADGDGLSDTQENWWCTDPNRADTDGDRTNDGAEVRALKDWMGNTRGGPPSATGKPFAGWPSQIPGCRDDDYDSVPDLAESLELGLNPNLESTDRDQFDDGQELFGTTNCPGSGGSCGYGSLPPANTAGLVLFPQMPSWVKAPGNHPLAAALPVISIDIADNSLTLERVTEISTEKGTMTQHTKNYSTAKTQGTSSSVADTVTWNDWEEQAIGITIPIHSVSMLDPHFIRPANSVYTADANWDKAKFGATVGMGIIGTVAAAGCLIVTAGGCAILAVAGALSAGSISATMAYGDMIINRRESQEQGQQMDQLQDEINKLKRQQMKCTEINQSDLSCRTKAGPTVPLQSVDYQRPAVSSQDQSVGSRMLTGATEDSRAVVQQYYQLSYPLPFPSQTTTNTKGHSWGGAQTTTHTQYEELTVTNGEAFTDGEDWRTATAVDSAHAADLRFTYTLQNTGTDFARHVCEIAFNIYIGDNPNPVQTYDVAPELGGDGCLSNIRPDPTAKITRTSRALPLNLNLMQAIDTGAPIRVVMERYVLSTEDYYAQDAANAGVRIAIEDGTDDGDEQIDNYLIPTWGDEKVLDVLARYFPHTTDAQGNLIDIWTPENRTDTPAWCVAPRRSPGSSTLWCQHALSTADWWNVYLSGLGDGSEGFQDTPAVPGSVALFRFNQDTDHDGYGDRSELRLGTDPRDAASVPHPELIAGLYQQPAINGVVTATLSLLNTGVYDAYGVEAVMAAPDDSISILNNTVGGSGRVRALKQVVVGTRILPPSSGNTWHGSAVPSSGGYYTGQQDRIYTFTVNCGNPAGCAVGSAAWSLAWNDGAGASGTLDLANYRSPRMLDVAQGLQISFLSGTVFNGDRFSVEAQTPRDTFQYRINRTPFTPPLVIVSYNDPQGNHRFALPSAALALGSPTDSLQPFSGQMLQEPGVELITTDTFQPGANTTRLVINNPSPATLRNAKLFLEFIDPQGTVVHEATTTVTLDAGPTIVPIAWNSSSFAPAYSADQDYIVMAFWTDYQGNILDTTGRPLPSFQADPAPHVTTDSAATWNFGTAQRGTLLTRPFPFANTGGMRLFTYINAPTGVSIAQGSGRRVGPADVTTYAVTLDTAALPAGAYDQTVSIRTSDPAHPLQTIRLVGTIVDAIIDTPPPATPQRPLDVSVPLAGGTQGSWVDFTHTLGPEPQSLHPARVYSQDYSRLWGVGRYATDFGQGTASAEMFGDGRDGDLVVGAGQTITINTTRVNVSGENIFVFPANSAGFSAGDTVLFHQSQGTANVGRWELDQIAAITSPTSWTLTKPLLYRYDNTNGRAQVIKVPQFHNVTVQSGGILTAPMWDGNTGGWLLFRAHTVTVNGTITMTGRGYRGGAAGGAFGINAYGQQGEGLAIVGGRSASSNNNGGGAGSVREPGSGANGGGGGGYNTNGGNGGWDSWPTQGGQYGQGGDVVGTPDLSTIFFGGGGGGGGHGDTSWQPWSGNGGAGGGVVAIDAANLTISGIVSSDGNSGQTADLDQAGGGGGAGGSVSIHTQNANLNGNLVTALGANGGARNGSGNGGNGGFGRIQVAYCDTLSGTTNPPASTQKLNCFITEQVEQPDYTHARLNLPESFNDGRTYQVQFARRFNFPFAAEGTSALRVPGGIFTSATLDALVSGVDNGPLTLRLDIGNDGTWDWETTQNLSGAAALSSINLAAAFSAYWSSHGAPAGSIDVPVRVSFSKAGQVLLTNLQVTPTGSTLRAMRLPAANYGLATLNLAVGASGSGPLTIAADVGDNGSIDWTWSGTPALPARLLTGNLASAINAYLAGRSGDVDVPVRFYLNPFLSLNVSGINTNLTIQPDAAVTAGDIGFSSAAPTAGTTVAADMHVTAVTPTEGDTVTVAATIHNAGPQPTGGITAAIFANVPSWGDWYVGSQYISDIPAGGTAHISVPWNTSGFSGNVPVRVIVDPYNRLAESNETNNQASTTIAIRPTAKPALTLSSTSLNFGSQTAGSPSLAQTVTLTNTGTADLTIDTITVNGNFSANNTCPSILAPGIACTMSVVFTPTAAGNRSGALTISSNAPASPHVVNLNGLGVGDNVTPAISLSAVSLNFSRQGIGTTSQGKSITVTNSGTAALTISAIAISGDFARTSACPSTLAVGDQCTVTITFTPTQEGNRYGTLTFISNAPGTSPTVTLNGTGAATISLSAGSLSFGSRQIGGASPPQTVMLTNPGSTSLAVYNGPRNLHSDQARVR